MSGCEHGPDGKCGRKIAAKGMCHSHRRMWLAGKPLDTPVRGYQKYVKGPDGRAVPVRASVGGWARSKPFEKENELLRSLGLRR